MLLTFAELQYLLTLTCAEPAVDVMSLLEQPSVDEDTAVSAGLASLVARGWCVDDPEHGVVSLDGRLLDVHAALHGAAGAVRITTVAPDRTTFWLLLVGAERLAITPAATGVFHVRPVTGGTSVRSQVAAIVMSALADEPDAGVTVTRTGDVDAMSFRTNLELGGATASEFERRTAVDELIDTVFVHRHPSWG